MHLFLFYFFFLKKILFQINLRCTEQDLLAENCSIVSLILCKILCMNTCLFILIFFFSIIQNLGLFITSTMVDLIKFEKTLENVFIKFYLNFCLGKKKKSQKQIFVKSFWNFCLLKLIAALFLFYNIKTLNNLSFCANKNLILFVFFIFTMLYKLYFLID